MTMRFITTCIVIVGLCLFALPLIPAYNGIQDERAQILASAASDVNLDVPPPIENEAFPTSVTAFDLEADAMANIEPAAGGDAAFTLNSADEFNGGFSGQAPAALADQPATAE